MKIKVDFGKIYSIRIYKRIKSHIVSAGQHSEYVKGLMKCHRTQVKVSLDLSFAIGISVFPQLNMVTILGESESC